LQSPNSPEYLQAVELCIIETMKALLKSMYDHLEQDRMQGLKFFSEKNLDFAVSLHDREIDYTRIHQEYTDLGKDIADLWEEPIIKAQFPRRFKYHVFDGAPYFFNSAGLSRFVSNYVPTFEDALHCRRKTTGVLEAAFTFNNNLFTFLDVGGQRTERRKWRQRCDVNALIFVISVADFDIPLIEDFDTNRMHDSLDLFDSVINDSLFMDKKVFVLFNKIDLLQEKLQYTTLTSLFPEFTGGNDVKKTLEFIRDQYLARNKSSADRIVTQFISVLDENAVKQFLDMFIENMIKK
jgi:guanine nucleotide-binding protein G(i) subunit alpha